MWTDDQKQDTGPRRQAEQTGNKVHHNGGIQAGKWEGRGVLTLERSMKGHGPQADDQISQEDEDGDARVGVGEHIA